MPTNTASELPLTRSLALESDFVVVPLSRHADDKEEIGHYFDMAADQENAPSASSTGGTKKSIRERVLCAVCCDTASGRYYGAIICEACKIFFIRSTRKGEPEFVCANGQRCEITPTTRLLCQACRYRKCIAVGMCRKEKTPRRPTPDQILCRVCLDVSSGIHFGVYTCEGCKGFFRRSSNSGDHVNYKCQGNRDCDITPTTRNLCRYCRYHKCLAEGMSRDKIQLGRHHKDGKEEKNDPAGFHSGVSSLSSAADDSSKMTNMRGSSSVKTEQHSPNGYQYNAATQFWVSQKDGVPEISAVSANFQDLEIKQDSNLSSPHTANGYQDSQHDNGSYGDGKFYSAESGEHLISQQPDGQDDMNQYYNEQMHSLPAEMEVSGFTGGSNLVAIQKIIDSEDYTTEMNVSSPSYTNSGTGNKAPCTLDMQSCSPPITQSNYYMMHSDGKTKVQKSEPKYTNNSPMSENQLPNQYNTAYLVNLEKDYTRDNREAQYQLSPNCMMSSPGQQHSTGELYHSSTSGNSTQGYSVMKEEAFQTQRNECHLPSNPAKSPRPNVIKYANEHHQLKPESSGYQMSETSRQNVYLPPGNSCCTGTAHVRPKSQDQYFQPTTMAPVTSHVTHHKNPEPYYQPAFEPIPEISLGEELHQHVPSVTKHDGIECWGYCPTHTSHCQTNTVSVTYPTLTSRPLDCKSPAVAPTQIGQDVKPLRPMFPELEPYAQDHKGMNSAGLSAPNHQERVHKDNMTCHQRHQNFIEPQDNVSSSLRSVHDDSGLEGFQEFWERVARDLLDEPNRGCAKDGNSESQSSTSNTSPIGGNAQPHRLARRDLAENNKYMPSSHKNFSKKKKVPTATLR